MNRKQMFLQAVQILAPGDEFILQAAQLVREEVLPARPGGAALEFVAAMERVRGRLPHRASAAFADAQVGQVILMRGNERANPIGIRFAEVAQTPTDGFVDEEFLLVKIVLDDFFQ